MNRSEPITFIIREEDGIQRGVAVHDEETKAELRALFKRLWERHPKDTARRVAELSGKSADEIERVLDTPAHREATSKLP